LGKKKKGDWEAKGDGLGGTSMKKDPVLAEAAGSANVTKKQDKKYNWP